MVYNVERRRIVRCRSDREEDIPNWAYEIYSNNWEEFKSVEDYLKQTFSNYTVEEINMMRSQVVGEWIETGQI